MKRYLLLLPMIAAPLIFGACAPTEYHSVRVYEYHKSKPQVKSNDPRDFKPMERF